MTDSEQPQRFCRNCGAQVRLGSAFCVSCGASLSPNPQSSNPPPQEEAGVSFQQRLQGLYEKAKDSWSRLDKRVKWGLLGLAALIVLILLSPIAKWVSIVALGISVLVLIVQAVRREPLKQWGILSVALLVSVWMFSGMANAIYGGGLSESSTQTGTALENEGGAEYGSYGSDPYLDELYDGCEAGDATSCEDLYMESPYDSEYEDFALSQPWPDDSEDRSTAPEADYYGSDITEAMNYGDNYVLDELYDRCEIGEPGACENLYINSPAGSEYEEFALENGGDAWSR